MRRRVKDWKIADEIVARHSVMALNPTNEDDHQHWRTQNSASAPSPPPLYSPPRARESRWPYNYVRASQFFTILSNVTNNNKKKIRRKKTKHKIEREEEENEVAREKIKYNLSKISNWDKKNYPINHKLNDTFSQIKWKKKKKMTKINP